jgi:hypothetical protein
MTTNQTRIASAIVLAVSAWSSSTFASESSPWVNEQGAGKITVSYGQQTADEFVVGDSEMMLPADLDLDTGTVSFSYGLTDRLSFDLQLGYAESDFVVDPVLAPQGGLSGSTDSRLGLRYSLYSDNGAAIAVRGTAIVDGGYRTGAITAIGDGGSGGEIALLAGKSFDSGFALSADVGYRTRGNDIPDEWFGGVNGSFWFNEAFGAYLGYQVVRSDGDLDIGAPGFSPARFPELDEDYDIAAGGLVFNFNDTWGGGLGYGRKVDGRNTALSDFWNISVSYSY